MGSRRRRRRLKGNTIGYYTAGEGTLSAVAECRMAEELNGRSRQPSLSDSSEWQKSGAPLPLLLGIRRMPARGKYLEPAP